MSIVEELQLNKFFSLLKASNKLQRKEALNEILKIIFKRDTNLKDSELLEIWENIHRLLVHILNDESEACRDATLDVLKYFLSSLPPADKHVIYTIPILTNRLGSQELIEQSEEVRLKSVDLLLIIIPAYKDFLPSYFENLVTILKKTVTDDCPSVKEKSCLCISTLAKTIPRYFYSSSENFVKPILSNFSHQHYKLRVISVKTIGDVLLYGKSKCMEEVTIPLAEKLFDQSPAVRSVKRPNLGCRVISQQNMCKLVGAIGRELEDWLADIRIRSAQLLCVLVLNIEQNVTQHVEKLLPSMYRACNDENKAVIENVQNAAEYMGYFIPPDIYCELVLPLLEENLTAGHLRVFGSILKGSYRKTLAPHLEKLGNFLQQKHVCQSRKAIFQQQILYCCDSLLEVCKNDCSLISNALFRTIFTVLSTTTTTAIENEAKLSLEKLAQVDNLENLDVLYLRHIESILVDLKNGCELWNIYTPEFHIFRGCFLHATSVIGHFLNHVYPIFEETMNQMADAVVRLKQFLLLSEYLSYQKDGTLIYGSEKGFSEFIYLLLKKVIVSGLVWSAGRTAEAIRTASVCCICSLLYKMFNEIHFKKINVTSNNEASNNEMNNAPLKSFTDNKHFSELFEDIIPILITLIDDDSKKTRLYSLEAVSLMMSIGNLLGHVTEEHIHQVYSVVLKRLDDGCDEVRFAALKTLKEVWKALPKEYDLDFLRSHINTLYTSTIVHLDDPEKNFQDLMLDILIDLSQVHPRLLVKKIENCRMNFRNQEGIDKLLTYIRRHLSTKMCDF